MVLASVLCSVKASPVVGQGEIFWPRVFYYLLVIRDIPEDSGTPIPGLSPDLLPAVTLSLFSYALPS